MLDATTRSRDGLFTRVLMIPVPGLPAQSPLRDFAQFRVACLVPGDSYDIDLQAVGTTPDQPAFRVTVLAPLGWQGYTYELFGTYALPESPPDVPRFQLLLGAAGFAERGGPRLDGVTLVAWRRRVMHAHSPVYLDAHWTAPHGEAITMGGLGRLHGRRQVSHAMALMAKGLTLLRTIEQRGRRRGPAGFRDAQEFEDELLHLIRTVDADGRPTTQEEEAQYWLPRLTARR